MEHRHILAAAVAGLFAFGAASGTALAQAKSMPQGMEKCHGIAKAGQNDCGSQFTAHSCAGQSKKDNDPNDFKFVKTGTCAQMGGKMQPAGKKS